MTYTLYIGNKRYSSWSMRPWVILRALDIPFEERLRFFKASRRQPHFLTFSPTGKVPCLHHKVDDSADQALVVWDSLSIVEHVSEKYPGVWPSTDRPAARIFARSAAAEMHSSFNAIRDECAMNLGQIIDLGGPPSEALQADLDRFTALFKYGLEQFGGPWLAGPDFTAVDAFYAPIAARCKTYGLKLGDKAAQEYLQRLLDHPAVQEWVEAAIRETEREPLHEEDSSKDRKVLEDLSEKSKQ